MYIKTMENLFTFIGPEKWPRVAVLWWTHGNEISGINACSRIIDDMISRVLLISCWELLVVSWVNEVAMKNNVRWIKSNDGSVLDMNRFFRPNPPSTDWYEYERSRELMPIIESADYLLDLHSTSWPSEPYAFAENESIRFAEKLWIWHIVSWWWQIQSWDWSEMTDSPLAGDIESYATAHWATGITFESGNHDAPDGEKNAYQIVLNFMVRAWILDERHYEKISNTTTKIHMTRVYRWFNDIFTYALDIKSNFMPLKEWTLIWHDGDIRVIAPADCILVMPTLDKDSKNTATGQKNKNIFQIWRYTME